MTRHFPYWARIQRLGSEHIFGVCVVTFGTWYLVILFDWVQGIMLASQGKVLSPGNEGSMAVIVYVSISPQPCLIGVHMPISGLKYGSFTQILIPCNNQLPSTIAQIQIIHTEGFQGCLRSRVDTQQLLSTRRSSHGAHRDTGVGHVHRIAPME